MVLRYTNQGIRVTHLSEHDKRLLDPGEDLESNVGRSALREGVLVCDHETLEATPLSDLLELLGFQFQQIKFELDSSSLFESRKSV